MFVALHPGTGMPLNRRMAAALPKITVACLLALLAACSTLSSDGKCLSSQQVLVTVPVDRCCNWDSKGNCTRTCTDLKQMPQTLCTDWACDAGYEQRNDKVLGLRCFPKAK